MRDMIISVICLICLIVPWSIYDKYSAQTINSYRTLIDDSILPAIQAEKWDEAEASMKYIAEDWDSYKSYSAFFVDTTSINEVDSMISKACYYVKCHDVSNSAGEIASLEYCLNYLHENELPVPKNIF